MKKEEYVLAEFEKRGLPWPVTEGNIVTRAEFEAGWEASSQDPGEPSELETQYQELAREDAARKKLPSRAWKRPGNRSELKDRFRRLYGCYLTEDDTERSKEHVSSMLDILGQLNTCVVYDRICNQPVYRTGDEEDIVQEAHIAAAERLVSDKANGPCGEDPMPLYTKIYKNKTVDYLRFYGLWESSKQPVRKNKGVKKANIRSACSVEAFACGADGQEQTDRIPELSVDPIDNLLHLNAKDSRRVLLLYLRQLMDNGNVPAAPLAVMYARVLYHAEKLLNPNRIEDAVNQYMQEKNWSASEDGKDYDEHLVIAVEAAQQSSTATAPDWAIRRMGRMSIRALRNDSEASLYSCLEERLLWGKSFTNQLSEEAAAFAPCTWGNLIYTDCYGKPQIENWAADIHNSTVNKTARLVAQDNNLTECVMAIFSGKNRLRREAQDLTGKRKEVHTR